jgi:putative copper export protein
MHVDEGNLVQLSLWIHIPIVTAWIGMVMIEVFASSAPGLSTEQRGRMIAWFRPIVVIAVVVILATGIWQTMRNPFMEVNSFGQLSDLRETTYGLALFIKHIFVLATFILTIVIHFYFGPRLMNSAAIGTAGGPAVRDTVVAEAQEPATRDLVLTRSLSIVNLLACLGALIFAARMVWQLH